MRERVSIYNHSVSALLDSGAGVTVLPSSFISLYEPDKPTTQRVTAANGTRIAVPGGARAMIHIGPDKFSIDCLISDQVVLPLLGIDWMSKHDVGLCCMFARGEIRICGKVNKLRGDPLPQRRDLSKV